MKRFQDKVVAITGAAGGIGLAAATRMAEEGATVVIADVLDEAGSAAAKRIGATFLHCDVSLEADVQALVEQTVERFGQLDVMYANAAVFGAVGPLAELTTEDFDLTLAINLKGVFLCLKHAARVMQARNSGVILATASPGGIIGGVGPLAYSAAKAGVIGMCRNAAAELRPHGIRVISIVPGAIASAMTADCLLNDPDKIDEAAEMMAADSLTGRAGRPEDLAGAIAFAASDDAAYLTGTELFVDAGYTWAHGNAWASQPSLSGSPALLAGGRRSR
ncbi:MAG: SDR family NAD(P)-dependent oxidoreductase [Parahaliea sp.]